jgi:hypothetical protein
MSLNKSKEIAFYIYFAIAFILFFMGLLVK